MKLLLSRSHQASVLSAVLAGLFTSQLCWAAPPKDEDDFSLVDLEAQASIELSTEIASPSGASSIPSQIATPSGACKFSPSPEESEIDISEIQRDKGKPPYLATPSLLQAYTPSGWLGKRRYLKYLRAEEAALANRLCQIEVGPNSKSVSYIGENTASVDGHLQAMTIHPENVNSLLEETFEEVFPWNAIKTQTYLSRLPNLQTGLLLGASTSALYYLIFAAIDASSSSYTYLSRASTHAGSGVLFFGNLGITFFRSPQLVSSESEYNLRANSYKVPGPSEFIASANNSSPWRRNEISTQSKVKNRTFFKLICSK